ncbi:hypothetical protein [Streptomyces sp. NPDC090025]|uniref:hypothetical protein n=1 Tax=Streptomyces sp. NPDC090025 TaxID=3365922 RepID=UPI003838B645
MEQVLTTGSTIGCGHPPQVPTMSPASDAKLKVGGQPVLRAADLTAASALISGCVPPSGGSPPPKPCQHVTRVAPKGEAAKLRAGGAPVLLGSLAGDTDGSVEGVTPQQKLFGKAAQTRLTAAAKEGLR